MEELTELIERFHLFTSAPLEKSPTLYWGLRVLNPELILNNPVVQEFVKSRTDRSSSSWGWWNVKDEFHITLRYVGKKPGIDEIPWSLYEGKKYTLRLDALHWDDKVGAISINPSYFWRFDHQLDPKKTEILKTEEQLPFPCQNARPHITVALYGKTPAVHSNQMLKSCHPSNTSPLDLTVEVEVFRYC